MTQTPLRRAPRYDFSFPLEFYGDQGTVKGSCLNLSESGLLATFAVSMDLWSEGKLQILVGEERHQQRVRVARVQELQAGLAFLFASEAERASLRRMLAIAQMTTHLVGAAPF